MKRSRASRLVRLAADRALLRRSAVTALVVGALLTAIGRGDDLLRGGFNPALAWSLPLLFAVPFAVSLFTAVRARDLAAAGDRGAELPDRNPNPVFRVHGDGTVVYANAAGSELIRAHGAEVGSRLSAEQMNALGVVRPASDGASLTVGRRTFRLHGVVGAEGDFINVYGTDITAELVVGRFPDLNPNPVLRVGMEGTLIYGNSASEALRSELSLEVGKPLPDQIAGSVQAALSAGEPFEVRGLRRVYSLKPVAVEEFGFITLYGTDVTAALAINKFPDQNPHPVLRVNPAGDLIYANAAASPILSGLGLSVGDRLPAPQRARIHALLAQPGPAVLEVTGEGRIFELLVVSNHEFEFVTLYGTDVTAARGIAAALAENERLLLNILPRAIAERLRMGEAPIADRFEAISVLFADVVNFTEFASLLEPSEVVQVLNGVFSIFDGLVDRHGLEKIKTIGDAYMVVGGLLGEPDHARRLADMGLEMMAEVEAFRRRTGHLIEVRAGMHTGPGAAGVIGVRKFVYDVWGDTVNTASRMESQGAPGRLQVTESTYKALNSTHTFEPRGRVAIKGKGELMTYFLTGRR